MGKPDMTKEEQVQLMPTYPQMLDMREGCFAGFTYGFNERNTSDDSPEEQNAYFSGGDPWIRRALLAHLGKQRHDFKRSV